MSSNILGKIDLANNHAAINFSTKSRMFLCLDFILDKNQDKSVIFNSKSNIDFTATSTYITREKIKSTSLDNIIQHTSLLINRGNFKDHLFALSKLHFTHEVGVRDVYDWLILATKNSDNIKLQDKATNLKKYLVEERKLSERFTINEWA